MNLTARCSIACSIVGVAVLDDPHIFNAGKRLAPKLFTIHCLKVPMASQNDRQFSQYFCKGNEFYENIIPCRLL